MADSNIIKVEDLAKVQNVEFVNRFNGGVQKLLDLLGASETITVAPGTAIKVYKTSGALASEQVGEGEDITLSKYENELAATYELSIKKYRKQTTVEAISQRGYEQAVTATDERMVRDIQKSLRGDILSFLATGTGQATGTTFQSCLANAWAKVEIAFEDDSATPVYFVNPLDIADYLGTASVTLQDAFGFSYIENFLGLGTVIVDSKVEQGKVYATAKENINVYSCDCAAIEGFNLYSDESGYIGIGHDTEYRNASLETLALTGMGIFAEYLDRIIVSTIDAAA